MPEEQKYMAIGKNVSLNTKTFGIVAGYMNKTRLSFSKTLNLILLEWDELTLEIQRIKRDRELMGVKNAKTIKPKPGTEKKHKAVLQKT